MAPLLLVFVAIRHGLRERHEGPTRFFLRAGVTAWRIRNLCSEDAGLALAAERAAQHGGLKSAPAPKWWGV